MKSDEFMPWTDTAGIKPSSMSSVEVHVTGLRGLQFN